LQSFALHDLPALKIEKLDLETVWNRIFSCIRNICFKQKYNEETKQITALLLSLVVIVNQLVLAFCQNRLF